VAVVIPPVGGGGEGPPENRQKTPPPLKARVNRKSRSVWLITKSVWAAGYLPPLPPLTGGIKNIGRKKSASDNGTGCTTLQPANLTLAEMEAQRIKQKTAKLCRA